MSVHTYACSVHHLSHHIMMTMDKAVNVTHRVIADATQHLERTEGPIYTVGMLKVHAASVQENGTSEFNAPAAICAIVRAAWLGILSVSPCLSQHAGTNLVAQASQSTAN